MLKHLVVLFGPQYSRIPPNAYAYIFVSADVVSIILQGVGGAISAVATEKKLLDQGVDIMIAGLVSQVFTLCIFAGLCVDFALQVKKNHDLLPPARQTLTRSLRFKLVTGAMAFAFLCIQTRCAYRVAELSQGWGSELMREENDFIIMDSL
jgi:SNF family Na+-dependent transporter